jgi:hypothetical protein
MDTLLMLWNGQAQLTSLLNECLKKTFISRTSQGTFLKGDFFLYKKLPAIILAFLKECDEGSSSLSITGKHGHY